MTVQSLVVYTDGGSRGNPGPSASGVVIMTTNRQVLEQFGVYLGVTTNNQAEYQAIELALKAASKFNPSQIDFYMDSELAARQLNGIYRVKNPDIKPVFERIKKLAQPYKTTFNHVMRESNRLADEQVNLAIDQALGLKKTA